MHEVGREPAAELCYGDLNGGRDLKYVYAPRWKRDNQSVQEREPAAARARSRTIPFRIPRRDCFHV